MLFDNLVIHHGKLAPRQEFDKLSDYYEYQLKAWKRQRRLQVLINIAWILAGITFSEYLCFVAFWLSRHVHIS